MMRRLTDPELVRRARRGSRSAAAELFERHWNRAWRVALAITQNRAYADDAAQQAFERAYRGIAAFDGRSSFATWLHRIVVNQALNTLRQERRRAEPVQAESRGFGTADERFDELADALEALPEERRLVLILRYWLDLTPPEIGDLLEIATGTVHSRLARGLEDLRKELEVENANER
jgi:RNA polymerase sigma-70 factor (ECF subfamily)